MLIALYWLLVIVGGTFFFVTFVLGELFEFGSDFFDGISDSIGGAVDAIGGIFEGADAADLEIALPDAGDLDFDVDAGPSPFSFRTMTMFASGFGAGGLVGIGMGLTEAQSLIPAFGIGVVLGFATFQFLRFFYSEQGGTQIQPTDYEGLMGLVTTSIPRNRRGVVMVEVKLQKKNMSARSEDGSPIPAQTQVQVVSMEGGTLIVKKLA